MQVQVHLTLWIYIVNRTQPFSVFPKEAIHWINVILPCCQTRSWFHTRILCYLEILYIWKNIKYICTIFSAPLMICVGCSNGRLSHKMNFNWIAYIPCMHFFTSCCHLAKSGWNFIGTSLQYVLEHYSSLEWYCHYIKLCLLK